MSGLGELGRPETPAGPGAPGARGAARPEQAPSPATTSPPAPETAADREPAAPRRGAADPVKALMHRHRELCERAVDPLEIAAGLEAHGITDRTATRFRHRDVFSLAEEMYARASRGGDAPPSAAPAAPRARADWALLTLLPGTLCAAAVAAVHLTHGQSRLFAAAAGTLAVALALRAALRRGPLSRPDRTAPGRATTWTTWLVAYALLGNGLLDGAVAGGPDSLPTGAADGPWPLTAAPVLALALACAPAAWTAHLFTARARRKLAASRGLEDFAAAVRPLLLGIFALFLGALAVLLTVCAAVLDEPAPYAETLTLGALLFLARLLTAHGFAYAPAVVLTATATLQAAALAAVFTSRLPGCGFVAAPVETLVTTWGAGTVPALACGVAALALLVHATRKLTRASAHAPPEPSR
ncbi:hypothetical protein QF034_005376 [Streptomyces africanus]|uniref:Integral membrane protein n=1 Tax=Streptomyces africanus TaxID=231024 RepID=A0ABU0QUR2_9ACTN|nr:hypothetical protein [Streptomyces africanus]MDQ0751145.1 hypothetical protein [Streptomyces africanus]